MADSPTMSDFRSALRQTEEFLASLVTPLTDEQLDSPAYPSEWTIAQTVSHLGSASIIFEGLVRSGLTHEPPPDMSINEAIWADWNAKSPHDQTYDGLAAIAAFGSFIDGISAADQDSFTMELFGGERRLADILSMRLNENAVHTWDVAVALDDRAALLPSAVELMIDNIGLVAQYTAKPTDEPIEVAITTTSPDRSFTLSSSGDGVQISARPAATDGATLRLSAEAWIRLVYGRLDADHTPPVEANGVALEVLRQVFPGP